MELPVRIAIAQKGVHIGHDLLMEIFDPKSEKYRHYLSAKEVGDMFRPSSEYISYFRKWLRNSGIGLDRHPVSAGRGWLKFNANVQELESLLLTEYHVYQHHETREELYQIDVILFQVDDLKATETYQGFANTFLDAIDMSYCTFEGGDDPLFDPQERCGAQTIINVISVSYCIAEGAYSYFYINRQCQEYMKFGLQGFSIIYSSQDSGVESGGRIHPDNVNKTTLAANPGAFSPGWPAACSCVTSVGATKINPGESFSESAAPIPGGDLYSGGRFSNL
ncbi:hypothetical protein TSTA_058330 [Talaromyces stipitatus ATCC 10500]|uniref:Peptidase S53 activation domain-containing protein n=1 Tax=Talaromyces stipitatus (strain ATCC 10500 / CBS 375.48 / QM 6759 / NRRL 1006) TaxID=441959 RepID=B8MQE2_TALSN|nr:uncharacterized protein TSTA_058330 [Talaromyces stipitatus ATCC 10500]EED13344.1 hypothetical protein TSTA_058330 [Talaromyces stipitatus ATCC 10500]